MKHSTFFKIITISSILSLALCLTSCKENKKTDAAKSDTAKSDTKKQKQLLNQIKNQLQFSCQE